MKTLTYVLLTLLTLNTTAQVLSTRKDKNGAVTKYARIQFGKDTVQMNVPIHMKDKPGVMLSISCTNHTNFFSFNIRSLDPKLDADTINKYGALLVLSLGKSDSLQIAPMSRYDNNQNFRNIEGCVFGYIRAYLSDAQLAVLRSGRLSGFRFYPGSQNYITIAVTVKEGKEFRDAIHYLTN